MAKGKKPFSFSGSGPYIGTGSGPASSPDLKQEELYRIGKYLSHAGVCSRRGAADFLMTHEVVYNGQPVRDLNFKVAPQDTLVIDGKDVRLLKTEVVLLNKPPGYVCTHKEQKNQKSIFRLLEPHMKSYFFAGRLDEMSRGLMVLSNNGDYIYNLTHPKQQVEKIYHVRTTRPLSEKEVEKIKKGVWSKQEKLTVDSIKPLGQKTNYEIILHEGKNREIRRIFQALKLDVADLQRIQLGSFSLEGLEEGKYIRIN